MSITDHQRRVPIRAIIMIFVALAIAFAALGWHSAATRDSDPDAALHAQAAKVSAAASGAASSASASASATPAAAPVACVFSQSGAGAAARSAVAALKKGGVTVAGDPAAWKGKAPRGTVVYYADGLDAAAKQAAAAIGAGATVQVRPGTVTECAGDLVVIVAK